MRNAERGMRKPLNAECGMRNVEFVLLNDRENTGTRDYRKDSSTNSAFRVPHSAFDRFRIQKAVTNPHFMVFSFRNPSSRRKLMLRKSLVVAIALFVLGPINAYAQDADARTRELVAALDKTKYKKKEK